MDSITISTSIDKDGLPGAINPGRMEYTMSTKDKLALMREVSNRNDERWNITSKEQEIRQTAVEYSAREEMMTLYIR